MRLTICALLTLTLLLGRPVLADEAADKLAAQKKNAEENWAGLEIGLAAHLETTHPLRSRRCSAG